MIKNKLYNLVNIGFSLILCLFLVGLVFYPSTSIVKHLILFVLAIGLVGLMLFIYTVLPKRIPKKTERLVASSLVIINVIKEIVLGVYLKNLTLSYFFLVLSLVVILSSFYLLIRKKYSLKEALFSLVVILLIPFGLLGIDGFTSVASLAIPVVSLFLYNMIDRNTLGRKKNVIIYFLLGAIASVSVLFHQISGVIILGILIDTIIARKRRYPYRFLLTSIFSFVFCLLSYHVVIENIEFSLAISWKIERLFPSLSSIIRMDIMAAIILLIIGAVYSCKEQKYNLYAYLEASLVLALFIMTLVNVSFASLVGLLPVVLFLLVNGAFVWDRFRIKHTNIYRYKHKKLAKNIEKVSVVIPNYNYENYIIERIDSVLLQTYPIYELIILDDCSKDNSVKVIQEKVEQIKKEYPNLSVQFCPSDKNSGNVFKQWEKAFALSKGDYLWIAEADDSCSNYFLANIMKGFQNKDVVISYCESLTMDQNNKILMEDLREWIDIFGTKKWDQSYVNTGKDEIMNALSINNTIANVSSLVFKKQKGMDYKKLLKKAQDFKLAGDWYFYVKVLEHGNIAYCHKSLNYHRMHGNSVTLTTANDREYREICTIQDEIIKKYPLSSEIRQRIKERRILLQRRFAISEEEIKLSDMSFEKIKKEHKIGEEMLLSIIIPVYNTEPFLDKCLHSVLSTIPKQTEVIIVNDGSPDNAEEIIKKYQKEYKGIVRYYKKENGGLSDTKNFGLAKATGKYIGFVDSDDWVSPRMYDCMLKKALIEDADIVYCDVELVYEDGTKRFVSSTAWDEEDPFMRMIYTPLMAASWSKIVKKELFEGLDYPKGYNNEDVAVSPILFARSKKTVTVPSPFYKYFQRTGSIQNSGFNEKRFVAFYTSKLCLERAKEFDSKTQEMIKGSVYTVQLLALLYYLIAAIEEKEERRKYIKMFCKEMNQFDDYDQNKYVRKYAEEHQIPHILEYVRDEDIKQIEKHLKKVI